MTKKEINRNFKRFQDRLILSWKALETKIALWKMYNIFYIRLSYLRFKKIYRHLFIRYAKIFGTIIYFLFLFSISIVVWKTSDIGLSDSNAVNFFVTSGAMIGGILAITFSLSILLMGSAAERLPVGFYQIASKDYWGEVIFFSISFSSLALFCFALSFGKTNIGLAEWPFIISIFIIGLVFYLCFWFYLRVRDRLNPEKVLQIASSQAFKCLDQINKEAHEIAGLLENIPNLNKKTNKETVLANAFQYLQTDMSYLNQKINYLFDYHDKLVAANERGSAARVLKKINIIYQRYFLMRKNTSIILPSGLFFVNLSDSHSFMAPGLERLMAIGEGYLRDNDDRGITNVIKFFVELCTASSEIHYVTISPRENPIFSQCRGYLDYLVKSIIKAKSFEASFQSAAAYGKIGVLVIDKDLIYEYEPVLKKLEEIAIHSLANREEIVVQTAIRSYDTLLSRLVLRRDSSNVRIKSLFEHVKWLVLLAYKSTKVDSLENNYFTIDTLALPFNTSAKLCLQLIQAIEESKDVKFCDSKKKLFFDLLENLWFTLRYLSEQMKNADHLLIKTFGDTIAVVGGLLLELTQNEKWTNERKELIKWASTYVYQTAWFAHGAEKIEGNLNFDSLVEADTKIGIRALQTDIDKIANDTAKAINSLANEMLKKQTGDHFGFTEPRIMVRTCFIGVLALKLDKRKIFNEVVRQIRSFETAYETKYFTNLPPEAESTSPTRDQLLQEMLGVAQKRSNYKIDQMSFNSDDAENKVFEIVALEDIEKFITEVWEVKEFSYNSHPFGL